ncbi:MAG TPA: hypothetical protein VKL99_01475 [Candidatus Angelobacter sp.]|nr:hypothetical protein [Candidatus Angelobacter sp.]
MLRRQLLQSALLLPLGALAQSQKDAASSASTEPISDSFPVLPPQLALDTLDAAHFDLDRLKALVEARPSLANAAVDWGFGDWETPLAAASHMGNRAIAEYLISRGAKPTIFSAAMLGHLEVVKAFIAAYPGIQRVPGQHGVTLLAHARIGGTPAAPVLEYLRSRGDADMPAPAPLTEAETKSLLGVYIFGSHPTERVEVSWDPKMYGTKSYTYAPQLSWTREGTWDRPLFHLGEHTFYPAGTPSVKIRFVNDSGGTLMTVTDAETVLTARKRVDKK